MNKNSLYQGIFGVLLFALPIISSATCVPLTRPLKLGSRGEDVRILQRALNSRSETTVAITGQGSANNETTYFGPATELAVKKFQLLNASTVLTPAGLSVPTGIIGKFSKDVLNNMICPVGAIATSTNVLKDENAKITSDINAMKDSFSGLIERINAGNAALRDIEQKASVNSPGGELTATSGPSSATTTPVFGSAGQLPLQLFSLGPMVSLRGTVVSLMGTGFSNTMHLRLGGNAYTLIGGPASDTASFVIPNDVPYGAYAATLEDRGVMSNARWLIIPQSLDSQPIINTVDPDGGNVGALITIKGKNFDAKNSVVTSFGVINDVPSPDGLTISFSLNAKDEQLTPDGKLPPGLPYFISIINKFGVSNFTQFKIQ